MDSHLRPHPADSGTNDRNRPVLDGLKVLEIGHYVAAPFCTRLLADLGADVIKIEPIGGDPVRSWGEQVDGNSLWWSVHGRNKRSIAVNLKSSRGRDIVLRLARDRDAVVENFRPGQLDRMGLSAEVLRAVAPGIVVASISGFGQTGPDRDRAAFGVIGEAIGGLRHLTNHPPGTTDLPPVRVGLSVGDSVAGLYSAIGILAAVWARDGKQRTGNLDVDVALTESVLSLTEAMLPEFGVLGKIKQPTGGAIATAAPSNAYPTRDGKWILIAANSEPLFARLAELIGRAEIARDPRFAGNAERVRNAAVLDGIIGDWSVQHDAKYLQAMLHDSDVPSCLANTAADCAADRQFREREMVCEVDDPLIGQVLHTGIVPRFPDSPGAIRWTGPSIGQHTDQVLRTDAGMDEAEIAALRSEGVIA
ncbi:CaiB/BaiF CoA transferase family protein [Pelagerythrobacter sp.]|uniref:CaiB/BaiF CoA transferase family protein n=1 Tax=Pelagerythrobacter sp. TaxID=2800702 RepID=UPI0035AF1153